MHREGETPFDITLGSGLIQFEFTYPPATFPCTPILLLFFFFFFFFYSGVIFYHKGESSSNHSCTVSVCLLSIHLLYKREES